MVGIMDITPLAGTQPAGCWYCAYNHYLVDGEYCPHCGRSQATKPIGTGLLNHQPVHPPNGQRGNQIFGENMVVLLQFLPSGTCGWFAMDTPLTLGRAAGSAADNLLDLTDFNAHRHGVSRLHCRLTRAHNRLLLTDLGSTNGTYLNGRLLPPHREAPLADGDHLILGTLHMNIFFVASSST